MTVSSIAPRYFLDDPDWKLIGSLINYCWYQGLTDMCLPESETELKWTCPGDSDPYAGLNYAEPEDDWPIVDHGCVSSPLFLPQPYSYPRTTLLDDGIFPLKVDTLELCVQVAAGMASKCFIPQMRRHWGFLLQAVRRAGRYESE